MAELSAGCTNRVQYARQGERGKAMWVVMGKHFAINATRSRSEWSRSQRNLEIVQQS
jgi:hypothetical protein